MVSNVQVVPSACYMGRTVCLENLSGRTGPTNFTFFSMYAQGTAHYY